MRNRIGWMAALAFLFGAFMAYIGYDALTWQFYPAMILFAAYGWVAAK
jgi:hypothetical protein